MRRAGCICGSVHRSKSRLNKIEPLTKVPTSYSDIVTDATGDVGCRRKKG